MQKIIPFVLLATTLYSVSGKGCDDHMRKCQVGFSTDVYGGYLFPAPDHHPKYVRKDAKNGIEWDVGEIFQYAKIKLLDKRVYGLNLNMIKVKILENNFVDTGYTLSHPAKVGKIGFVTLDATSFASSDCFHNEPNSNAANTNYEQDNTPLGSHIKNGRIESGDGHGRGDAPLGSHTKNGRTESGDGHGRGDVPLGSHIENGRIESGGGHGRN